MNDETQFETIAALRAYAQKIIDSSNNYDIRPSTAKIIFEIVRKMHNIKDRLEIR